MTNVPFDFWNANTPITVDNLNRFGGVVFGNAQTAISGAERCNVQLVSTTEPGQENEVVQLVVTDRDGNVTKKTVSIFVANSWSEIQAIVAAGTAEQVLPVGTTLSIGGSSAAPAMAWRVRAHNHHRPANVPEGSFKSMTLESLYVVSDTTGKTVTIPFSDRQAIAVINTEVPAGTTCTINWQYKYYNTQEELGPIYFTPSTTIPAGSLIAFRDLPDLASTSPSRKTLEVWNSEGTEMLQEGISISTQVPVDITSLYDLGTINDSSVEQVQTSGSEFVAELNIGTRIIYGSNNYDQSLVRRWLNSDSADFQNSWTQSTKFSVARTIKNKIPATGFVQMVADQEEFLAAVQPAIVPCTPNTRFEVSSLEPDSSFEVTDSTRPPQSYTVKDRFFLLSTREMYGDRVNGTNTAKFDGEILSGYVGVLIPDHAKYSRYGQATAVRLRTAAPSNPQSNQVIRVSADQFGDPVNNVSRTEFAVCPACIIAASTETQPEGA